jgi:hypothetical protein
MIKARFLIGGLLLVAAGCRNSASGAGTAIRVTITFDNSVVSDPTQLSFTARDLTEDAGVVFANVLDPSDAGATPLQNPSSVLIELSNHPGLGTHTLDIHVDGLVNGTPVASGDSTVTVADGLTVPVAVTISAPGAGDAGHDGGADGGADGGGDAGPGCAGCTTCCLVGTCLPAASVGFANCGADGGQCTACSAQSADNCSVTLGTCACGNAPACTATSDTCLSDAGCVCGDAGTACPANELCEKGACHCGGGGPCPSGTACDSLGQCLCSADAGCSSGCCARGVGSGNDSCDLGTADNLCGKGGVTCQDCTQHAGGTCNGQVCSSCNPTNCGSGCCLNGTCTAPGFPYCGDGGLPCASCDLKTANGCGAAGCQCGKNPACSPGQTCTDAGTCICSSSNCPGCCDTNNNCLTPSSSSCGTNGGACTDCGAGADGCLSGSCRCDGGSSCSAGLTCAIGGQCVCAPQNCSGCCSGDQCITTETASACGTNDLCIDCFTGIGLNAGNNCCPGAANGPCICGGGCPGLLGGVHCTGSQKCVKGALGYGCN